MTARFCARVLISLVGCAAAYPQGRPIDWPSSAGDAQRTGWEKVDTRITKDNVKDFQLVMKRKLENAQGGPHSLTPPVVIGLLISYRGFKELAFVAGSSDNLWAIDVDLDRIFWQKHFDGGNASGPCAGGNAVTPALIPPTNFANRPRPGAGRKTGGGAAAKTPETRPTGRGILGAGGFGAPRPVFFVTSDGKLHLMNTSTGDDVVPAIPFLPANSKAFALTVVDNTVYTTTSADCGESAVWAIDLSVPEPKAVSYHPDAASSAGLGGLAMGTDGTVYVETAGSNAALLALTPKELKLKQSISAGAIDSAATPVVFAHKGRDLIVTAGADKSLSLWDSKSLGDQKKPLYQTKPVTDGKGVWGGLSSWQDADGARWVFAPVWGAVNRDLNLPAANGNAPNGSIVAFKLEDKDGKTLLTPAWVSRDMTSPQPPVITGGLVFALATAPHATLYAFDAATGKEMYSTGDQVTAPGQHSGVTLANGRVFFTTTDNTLYGFGIYLER